MRSPRDPTGFPREDRAYFGAVILQAVSQQVLMKACVCKDPGESKPNRRFWRFVTPSPSKESVEGRPIFLREPLGRHFQTWTWKLVYIVWTW